VIMKNRRGVLIDARGKGDDLIAIQIALRKS
jgi:hypothetical protein